MGCIPFKFFALTRWTVIIINSPPPSMQTSDTLPSYPGGAPPIRSKRGAFWAAAGWEVGKRASVDGSPCICGKFRQDATHSPEGEWTLEAESSPSSKNKISLEIINEEKSMKAYKQVQ